MRRLLAALLTLCALGSPVAAEIGPPTDLASRARGAGKVVVARIVDVQAQYEVNRFGDRLIVSHAVLEVLETWKGAPQNVLDLAVEGGTVGDMTLRVSDMPSVRAGERAVFFLDADARGGHTPNGRGRGIIKLDDADRVEGATLSLNDLRQQVRGALGQGQGGR